MNKPLVPRVFETLVLLIRPVVPSACFPMSRKELCEPLLPHMNAHGEKTGSTEYETKALKSLERRHPPSLFHRGSFHCREGMAPDLAVPKRRGNVLLQAASAALGRHPRWPAVERSVYHRLGTRWKNCRCGELVKMCWMSLNISDSSETQLLKLHMPDLYLESWIKVFKQRLL